MTFKQTLYALLKETEKTTIFAMNSYGDAKIGIGFRRACVYSELNDPVIDGVNFMLCADAWDDTLDCPIANTFDLLCKPKEEISIRLRAVCFCPYTTIDLGTYKITDFECSKEWTGDYYLCGVRKFPQYIRLDIERLP